MSHVVRAVGRVLDAAFEVGAWLARTKRYWVAADTHHGQLVKSQTLYAVFTC